MKVTQKLDIKLVVRAALDDDDELRVTLTSSMPYAAGRSAATTIEEFSDETRTAVYDALRLVLAEGQEKAVFMAQRAAQEAAVVAARLGEI